MNMIPVIKRAFLMAVHGEAEQLEVDAVDRPDSAPQMMVAAAIIARINCILWEHDTVDAKMIGEIVKQEAPDPAIQDYVRAGLDRAFKTLDIN